MKKEKLTFIIQKNIFGKDLVDVLDDLINKQSEDEFNVICCKDSINNDLQERYNKNNKVVFLNEKEFVDVLNFVNSDYVVIIDEPTKYDANFVKNYYEECINYDVDIANCKYKRKENDVDNIINYEVKNNIVYSIYEYPNAIKDYGGCLSSKVFRTSFLKENEFVPIEYNAYKINIFLMRVAIKAIRIVNLDCCLEINSFKTIDFNSSNTINDLSIKYYIDYCNWEENEKIESTITNITKELICKYIYYNTSILIDDEFLKDLKSLLSLPQWRKIKLATIRSYFPKIDTNNNDALINEYNDVKKLDVINDENDRNYFIQKTYGLINKMMIHNYIEELYKNEVVARKKNSKKRMSLVKKVVIRILPASKHNVDRRYRELIKEIQKLENIITEKAENNENK